MRRALALVALGLLAVFVQGALATHLRPPWSPDLGLLVVVAFGLHWRGFAGGLCASAALGYVSDVLSGSLFGQHALLRLLAFAGARLASRQLNLRGPLPLAIFAAALTAVYALALLALTSFFTGAADWGLGGVVDTLRHALINALGAPVVAAAVERVATWTGEDEAARRPLRLEPRSRLS